jgi:hypothetical protein
MFVKAMSFVSIIDSFPSRLNCRIGRGILLTSMPGPRLLSFVSVLVSAVRSTDPYERRGARGRVE